MCLPFWPLLLCVRHLQGELAVAHAAATAPLWMAAPAVLQRCSAAWHCRVPSKCRASAMRAALCFHGRAFRLRLAAACSDPYVFTVLQPKCNGHNGKCNDLTNTCACAGVRVCDHSTFSGANDGRCKVWPIRARLGGWLGLYHGQGRPAGEGLCTCRLDSLIACSIYPCGASPEAASHSTAHPYPCTLAHASPLPAAPACAQQQP